MHKGQIFSHILAHLFDFFYWKQKHPKKKNMNSWYTMHENAIPNAQECPTKGGKNLIKERTQELSS